MFDLKKADYHVHSYFSDGEFSPEYVVEKFAKMGYKNLAIMDHDGVDGVLIAEKRARELGVNYRRGLEFSTRTSEKDLGIHLLGYDIDIENEELVETLEKVREWRVLRNEKIYDILKEMGMPLTPEEVQERPGQTFIGKPVFARAMIKKGYIKDMDEAFSEKVFGNPKLTAIKKKSITTEYAINLVKKAGGIPVFAHPGLVKHIGQRESDEFFNNMDKLISHLTDEGLKGIECVYSKHSEYEVEKFKQLAGKYGLYITKGSDFHDERDKKRLEYIENIIRKDYV